MRAASLLLVGTLIAACGHAPAGDDALAPPDEPWVHDDGRVLVREPVIVAPLPRGVALPYPLDRVFGTFGDCRGGGRQHLGLDLGGVGPDEGLGTPIRSMVRARVVAIHRPEDAPGLYGRRDTRAGTTERSGKSLPRGLDVPGYGRVHFFTRDYGSWRTGEMIVTVALDTGLAGHQIRYMHLGAVHPELRVGDVVEAGQEIAVMGGTAILESLPHVHIDIEDDRGRRIDVAPWLGMEPDTRRCR